MKIKFLVSVSSSVFGSPQIGEPVDVPDDEAQRFIDSGAAEKVAVTKKKVTKKKVTKQEG